MIENISKLVDDEVIRSRKIYEERFTDIFHASGVLKSEIDEANDEMKNILALFDELWELIRNKSDYTDNVFNRINNTAMLLACEAIQVAAMAQKAVR